MVGSVDRNLCRDSLAGILSTNPSGALSPRQGASVSTMPNRHVERTGGQWGI